MVMVHSEPTKADITDLPSGTQLGEYVIKHKIAEGGMGQIYAGVQPIIGKKVAIKVLAHSGHRNGQLPQRFLLEAQAVNRINHPSIVDIFSFGHLPDGRPYFVMEFLCGETLEGAIDGGTLSPAELVEVLKQLCEVLGAVHAKGVVHRDLKPENLWVERQPDRLPNLKMLDFGIAKDLSANAARVTSTGDVLGTPHYMAPEQALGRAADERTDIYAVGMILYRIFGGVLPFEGDNARAIATRQVTEMPVPLHCLANVPRQLDRIVMSCLCKDPVERPQTARELWSQLAPALEAWIEGEQGRRNQKPRLLVGLLFGVLIIGGVTCLVIFNRGRPAGVVGTSQSAGSPLDVSYDQVVSDARCDSPLPLDAGDFRPPSNRSTSSRPTTSISPGTFRLPPLAE